MQEIILRQHYAFSPILLLLSLFFGCATSVSPYQGNNVSADIVNIPQAQHSENTEDVRAQQLFVRGMTFAFSGDYKKALETYEQVMQIRPNEPAVLSSVAEAYEGLGDLPTAVFYAERAAELAPDNAHYRQQLASLHLRAGDTDNAAETYKNLVERFPDNTAAMIELARILAQTGQTKESIRIYEQLIQTLGESPEIYREILQLYFNLEDFAGVEKTLKALIDAVPGDINHYRMLGDLYRQQEKHQEAISVYRSILSIHPDDYDAALTLSELYRLTGNESDADSLQTQFDSIEDASAVQLVSRAASMLKSHSGDSASVHQASILLERALEVDNENIDALTLLGEIRLQSNRFEEAADLLYRVLERNPRDPARWYQVASAYLQAEKNRRAAEVADEALLLFPGQLDLLHLSGTAWMEANVNESAIERFEVGLEIIQEEYPSDKNTTAQFLSALALLNWRTGHFENSDSLYERVIAENPEDALSLNNYAYSLAERGIHLERALSLANRAVKVEPENASFLDTLGWIYFKKGEIETARTWIEKATASENSTSVMLEHLGDIYDRLGDTAKAKDYWGRALDKNPDNQSAKSKLDR